MKWRDKRIDILKGMLVFGMIFSHVSGLISNDITFPIKFLWLFIGLVTFSGFIFSFGYVCQLAYFSKDLQAVYQRMVITGLKPLIAFYISAIYWRIFIDKSLSRQTITNILFLKDIPPFSEFLISFSLTILASLFLFKPIQKLTSHQNLFLVTVVLLLLTSFIPYSTIRLEQLGLLVGTEQFPSFPVLQYFPIYLLGIYFAKHQLSFSKKVIIISFLGLVGSILFYFITRQTPERFPPSPLWIITSFFFVQIYYLIAQYISSWQPITRILSTWGENVLFYLLISNIFIFTFRGVYEQVSLPLIGSLGITILILILGSFLLTTISPSSQSNVSFSRQSNIPTK